MSGCNDFNATAMPSNANLCVVNEGSGFQGYVANTEGVITGHMAPDSSPGAPAGATQYVEGGDTPYLGLQLGRCRTASGMVTRHDVRVVGQNFSAEAINHLYSSLNLAPGHDPNYTVTNDAYSTQRGDICVNIDQAHQTSQLIQSLIDDVPEGMTDEQRDTLVEALQVHYRRVHGQEPPRTTGQAASHYFNEYIVHVLSFLIGLPLVFGVLAPLFGKWAGLGGHGGGGGPTPPAGGAGVSSGEVNSADVARGLAALSALGKSLTPPAPEGETATEGEGETSSDAEAQTNARIATVEGYPVFLPTHLGHLADTCYSLEQFVSAAGGNWSEIVASAQSMSTELMTPNMSFSPVSEAAPVAEAAPANGLNPVAAGILQYHAQTGGLTVDSPAGAAVPGSPTALTPGSTPVLMTPQPLSGVNVRVPTVEMPTIRVPSLRPVPRMVPVL